VKIATEDYKGEIDALLTNVIPKMAQNLSNTKNITIRTNNTKQEKFNKTSSKPDLKYEEKTEPEINIDYNQVFLDVFLDKGRKEYYKKEEINLNEISQDKLISGKIIIRVIVDKKGKVESARVLRGINDSLNNAALKAAKETLYIPGTLNNNPVRFSASEVFNF